MIDPDKMARGPEEFVKCPECDMVQKAKKLTHIKHTHPCKGCGHLITCEEWETINTRWTDEVRCPHCGCEVKTYRNFEDRGGDIIDCIECSKEFHLAVEKTVEYTTLRDCELEGKKHQWTPSRSISSGLTNYYDCINCDQSKEEPKILDDTIPVELQDLSSQQELEL